MFGTFVEEDQQRDYYGTSAQVQTFDPLQINVEVFKRINENGKDDSILSRICKMIFGNRITHKWVFDPMTLVRPHKNIWDCWNISTVAKRKKFSS